MTYPVCYLTLFSLNQKSVSIYMYNTTQITLLNPLPPPPNSQAAEKPVSGTNTSDHREMTSDLPVSSVELGDQLLVDFDNEDSDTGELVTVHVQALYH